MAESRVAFDLQIPSDVEYIEGVVELARQRCRELKLSPAKCSLNVPVALSEALSNAILRGNDKTGGKQVRIRAIVSDEYLVFEIVDDGPGFDRSSITPGHGLDNLQDRLATLFNGAGRFDIVQRGNRSVAMIALPVRRVPA